MAVANYPPYSPPPPPPPYINEANPTPPQTLNANNLDPAETALIAALASLGGVFLLALIVLGLIYLFKKKKIDKETISAGGKVSVKERKHVHEIINTGPCGERTATITVDDDVRVHDVEARGTVSKTTGDGGGGGKAFGSPYK